MKAWKLKFPFSNLLQVHELNQSNNIVKKDVYSFVLAVIKRLLCIVIVDVGALWGNSFAQ